MIGRRGTTDQWKPGGKIGLVAGKIARQPGKIGLPGGQIAAILPPSIPVNQSTPPPLPVASWALDNLLK